MSVSRLAGSPHLRAGDVDELRHAAQRRAALLRNFNLLGQHHRQLLVRNLHQAALLAVNDRDRRAPVALAAHPPILQPEGDLGLAKCSCDGDLLELLFRVGAAQSVVLAGVDRARPLPNRTEDSLRQSCRYGLMTCTIGRPYFVANSKSRSSCAGTLMMAPVP